MERSCGMEITFESSSQYAGCRVSLLTQMWQRDVANAGIGWRGGMSFLPACKIIPG